MFVYEKFVSLISRFDCRHFQCIYMLPDIINQYRLYHLGIALRITLLLDDNELPWFRYWLKVVRTAGRPCANLIASEPEWTDMHDILYSRGCGVCFPYQ